MNIDTASKLALLLALVPGTYFFIFRGRKRGYEALASRTIQLQQSGVKSAIICFRPKVPAAIRCQPI